MTLSCAVTQDLLPLYFDNVCSAESRGLVEEHLSGCDDCRRKLAELKTEFRPSTDASEAAAPIRALSKLVHHNRRLAFLLGVTAVSAVGVIVTFVAYQVVGSTVITAGFLDEPFYLIPLRLFFGLVAVVAGLAAAITAARHRSRR